MQAYKRESESDIEERRKLQLESASNRLLRRHRGKKTGIYTESDIRRREYRERSLAERIGQEISTGANVEWVDPNIVPEAESHNITLAELELLAGLTPRQKRVIRLMKRHKKQCLVAAVMKVKPAAVSRMLRRSYNKVRMALDELASKMPSDQAEELFRLEIQYKKMLTYRKPGGRKWRKRKRREWKMQISVADNDSKMLDNQA